MTDLRHIAARYRLGLQDAESLVRAADALLTEGYSEPAIIQLSMMKSPIVGVAGPIFEQACIELGLAIPSRDEAINEVLRNYLESLASGARPPYEGLSLIMCEVYPHFIGELG